MDNELRISVLAAIDDTHTKTGGKCGISPVEISIKLNVMYSEIKEVLNQLFQDKAIIVKKGINGYLLFKKL